MSSCDTLYIMSGGFSLSGSTSGDESALEFASTCGGRTDEIVAGWCEATGGEGFREACSSGDMFACDLLYFNTPPGSDDETFGATCGGRSSEPVDGFCEETFGSSVP
jgi:hypothetical protein